MPLYVSRFGHFPHILKLVVLLLNICLIIVLCKSPTLPAGSTIVWITVAFSIIVDAIFSVVIILQLEQRIFPLWVISYGLLERSVSMIFLIAYFTCMWLIFGESKLANKGWFNTAALLCLAVAATYLVNFTLFLRQWMREVRAAQSQENLFHEEV